MSEREMEAAVLAAQSAGVVRQQFRSSLPLTPFSDRPPAVPDLPTIMTRDGTYDARVAYMAAVASAWAYSDGQTLADKLRYYGFPRGTAVEQMTVLNDALLIVARAYLARSPDGTVGVLAFRGTEPANVINWMTALDTVGKTMDAGKVHQGFHANLEGLWDYVEDGLDRACRGDGPMAPMEHLFVTGHSLGGAMAVLTAARMFASPRHAAWRDRLRGVYTFGQPCVGDPTFAGWCAPRFGARLFRHEYGRDLIPQLPPRELAERGTPYAHCGTKRVASSDAPRWRVDDHPTVPVRGLITPVLALWAGFWCRRIGWLRALEPRLRSIDDHVPQRYIDACKATLEAAAAPVQRHVVRAA